MVEMFLEAEVAKQLGVERALLREIRTLVLTDDDVTMGPRGAMAYTRSGLEKIAREVRTRMAAAEGPGLQQDGQGGAMESEIRPAAPEIVRCVVVKIPRFTVKRLEVRTLAGDAPLVVRVRDNSFFIPGMEVQCQVRGRTGYVYGRLPRRKGAW